MTRFTAFVSRLLIEITNRFGRASIPGDHTEGKKRLMTNTEPILNVQNEDLERERKVVINEQLHPENSFSRTGSHLNMAENDTRRNILNEEDIRKSSHSWLVLGERQTEREKGIHFFFKILQMCMNIFSIDDWIDFLLFPMNIDDFSSNSFDHRKTSITDMTESTDDLFHGYHQAYSLKHALRLDTSTTSRKDLAPDRWLAFVLGMIHRNPVQLMVDHPNTHQGCSSKRIEHLQSQSSTVWKQDSPVWARENILSTMFFSKGTAIHPLQRHEDDLLTRFESVSFKTQNALLFDLLSDLCPVCGCSTCSVQ